MRYASNDGSEFDQLIEFLPKIQTAFPTHWREVFEFVGDVDPHRFLPINGSVERMDLYRFEQSDGGE
jgi:hypothetical protein